MNTPRTEPLIDLDIDSINTAGDGLGRHRGRDVAVPFTIPGERVRVRLGTARTDSVAARLVEILRPSPHRMVARCAHFGPDAEPGVGPCGGCTWQHIAYPEQLRLKTDLVTRLVRAAVPRAPAARLMLPGTSPEDPWGYRHKVHFVFGSASRQTGRSGAVVMGHYVRGSRRIVPVRECPVHDEAGNALAFALRTAFDRSRVGAAGAEGTLKSIGVRVGFHTPELMATLVVSNDADKRLRAATRRVIEGRHAPSSFHLNIHPRDDGFIFGRETRRIAGPERMREEVAGAKFLISPTAFFQTNVAAAEVLVRLAIEAIPPDAAVLDLYAGAGLFALPLALAGHEVVAVEESRAAVADAEAGLRLNRVEPSRCRFIAERVETVLRSPGAFRLPAVDTVILDPPRDGCDPGVLDTIFGDGQPRIAVYISCNPEALARDLARITPQGYRIHSLQPVDMFPHTAHVETMAVLAKS